jgi:hypothetical protein
MKTITLIALIALSIILFKCRPECEEPELLENSGLGLVLMDASTGKNIYLERDPSRFNKEDFKVTDEYGNDLEVQFILDLEPSTGQKYYRPAFYPIFNFQTDRQAFEKEIKKKFYLKLNQNVTDSLTTIFKAEKTNCGSRFTSLKIFHNSILVKEASSVFELVTLTISN